MSVASSKNSININIYYNYENELSGITENCKPDKLRIVTFSKIYKQNRAT